MRNIFRSRWSILSVAALLVLTGRGISENMSHGAPVRALVGPVALFTGLAFAILAATLIVWSILNEETI